ncbi:MAG TPA: DUF4157 domain-containing protein [Allosphingosinicella sp.]|jgi:hypothetical protein
MTSRALTSGEIKLAREAFGDSLPYQKVRFVDGHGGNPIARAAFRNGNSAITLRRTIYFGPAYYLPDFAVAKPAAKGLFVHEMTHVWQYRRLWTLPFFAIYGVQFAAVGFKAWRMYEYEQGKTPFRGAKLEAQAEMAGNYAEAKVEGDAAKMALIAKNLARSGLFGL